MSIWNVKEFEKLWNKLNVPKKYETMRCNMNVLTTHNITMNLSIREDSGKTSQAILYALCFNKLWNVRTAYLRSDETQITRGKIADLCDNMVNCGYLDTIFEGKYNCIKYVWNEHKFYLGKKIVVEGETVTELSETPFMYAVCNENYLDYKSTGISDEDLNFMIFDEFMDTKRSTQRQMIEFMNNISTFGRPLTRTYIVDDKENKLYGTTQPKFRVLMLGNNTQLFSQWFEEFCIEDDIPNLKFGSYIDRTTELGTTFACHLLATSNDFKEKRKKANIPFFGFNTPKMNAFNGLQEWQSESHPHIPTNDFIDNSSIVLDNIYIKHRNKYIRVNLYEHNDTHNIYLFMHFSKQPYKNDRIVLSLLPVEELELYGFGEYNDTIRDFMSIIVKLIRSNCVYFSTNSVGDLFNNYCTEYKKNKKYV